MDTLIMNPTDNDSDVVLGNVLYLDLDSQLVCGTITLPPYTSRILIRTNTTCNNGIDRMTATSDMRVVPNPADTLAQLYLNPPLEHTTFYVLDELGRVVASGTTTGKYTQLPAGTLAPGMYMFRVENSTQYTRWIKSR